MSEQTADLPYWIAFSRVPTVCPVRVGLLEGRFGSLQAAWQASEGELRAAGLDANVVEAIASVLREVEPDRELARVLEAGVTVLTWHDGAYPKLLREIEDLPFVIYMKGDLEPGDALSVTVVGTRRPTSYGREAARQLAGELAKAGVTVVSGLARGIDGVAHRASLEAGGRTIAVLGCGVDVPYPPEHGKLMEEIVEQGALLSEYPLGTKPEARHFPRRNRLLSGLSLGTLVIEAGEGSGTLTTVKYALEQNREVFCVPGSIYSPASTWTNHLTKEGAKLVAGVDDVLEELHLDPSGSREPLPEAVEAGTEDEELLLDMLDFEPQHVDDLCGSTGLPVTRITGALAVLEMKGRVLQVGRMHYIRAREAPANYTTAAEG